jgi:RND family efflux transporter MFP subunit
MKTPSSASILVVAAALILSGCTRSEETSPAENRPAERVAVVTVVEDSAPRVIAVPGEVRAADRAVLAAKVAGNVQELAVKLGQTVRAGDVLIRLSAPEYGAQLERARTALAQAERELDRDQRLLMGGVTTDDAVRFGEERLRSAQAAFAEAEAMLAYTEIKAPFDGLIAARPVNRGDLVMPGQALITLDLVGPREVIAQVPASLVGKLSLGATVRVLNGGDDAVEATVSEIASASDAATRSVAVVLTLPEGNRWAPGQFVTVELSGDVVKQRLVPVGAVRVLGQMENVFVVSEGRAQMRLVQAGRVTDGLVEILAGLEPGERIVAAPAATLRDGQLVEVSP